MTTEPTQDNNWESTLTGFTITPKNESDPIYIDGVEVEKKALYTLEAGKTHTVEFEAPQATVTEPIYVRNAATGSPYVSLEGSMTIGYTALDAENNIPYYHLNLAKGNVPQLNNYSMNKSIDTTKDKMYLVVYLRSETSGKTAILYDWSSGKPECSDRRHFAAVLLQWKQARATEIGRE